MKLEVYVFRRPNMFKVNDNLYNMIGYGELKNMFTIENYKTKQTKLDLFFPERFLNILEIRDLMNRIEYAGYQDVYIVTGNEHLLTTVHSENIRIYQDVYIVTGNEHLLTTVHSENIRIYQDELIPEGKGLTKLSNDFVGLPDDMGIACL